MSAVQQIIAAESSGASGLSLISAITTASLTTNLQLCLDAGDSASYDGSSQTWADRSGNAMDFYRGANNSATTDDPTFNGSAGALSSNEYFSYDGGDYFTLVSGSNPAWVQTIHKDAAKFSALVGFYNVAGTNNFCGTKNASNDIGSFFKYASIATNLTFSTSNGTTTILNVGGDALGLSAWHIVGVSVDENGGASGSFFYADGAYNQVSSANTWNASYTSPSASSATYAMCVGSQGNGGTKSSSGSRLAFIAMWNTNLSKANFDTLYAAMKGRLGLS